MGMMAARRTGGSMGMMASNSPIQKCCHCGMYHVGSCYMIAVVEYFPNGAVKRIEYRQPATDWPLVETDMADWGAWAKEG